MLINFRLNVKYAPCLIVRVTFTRRLNERFRLPNNSNRVCVAGFNRHGFFTESP